MLKPSSIRQRRLACQCQTGHAFWSRQVMEPYVTFTDDTILEGTAPWERPLEGLPLAPIPVDTPSAHISEGLEGTKVPDSGVPLTPQEMEEPTEVPATLMTTVSKPAEESGIPPLHQKQNSPPKNKPLQRYLWRRQPLQRRPRRNQPLWWSQSVSQLWSQPFPLCSERKEKGVKFQGATSLVGWRCCIPPGLWSPLDGPLPLLAGWGSDAAARVWWGGPSYDELRNRSRLHSSLIWHHHQGPLSLSQRLHHLQASKGCGMPAEGFAIFHSHWGSQKIRQPDTLEGPTVAMIYTTHIVQDEATGVTYMETVTISVGKVALSNPHMAANLWGAHHREYHWPLLGGKGGWLPLNKVTMVVLTDSIQNYANLLSVFKIIILVVVLLKLFMCMSKMPWWLVSCILHFLCTLFKASTHLVVLVFSVAMGHCWLCSYSWVCLYLVYLHVFC